MTKNFLYIATVAAALTSCSSNDELSSTVSGDASNLNIAVNINDAVTGKASVDATDANKTNWDNGDKIGITVLTTNETATADLTTHKYGTGIANVPFTYSSTDPNWTGTAKLANTDGYVYSYYPYAENQSGKDISLSNGSTAYLYGTVSSAVSSSSRTADITMNHAMAKITLSIAKSTEEASKYTGVGKMTAFTAKSQGWAAEGTLNYLTGDVTSSAPSADQTLTMELGEGQTFEGSTAITQDYYVIPIKDATTAQKVTYNVTVDGVDYTAEVTMPEVIAKGKHYTLPVKLKDTSLILGTVTITDWGTGTDVPEGSLVPAVN